MTFLLILLAVILLVILSIAVTVFFYKFFKRKDWRKTAFIFPALFALYCYVWYDAFYPSDKFYKTESAEILGYPLPLDAEVVSKSASFPDQHGDYAACAAIKLSTPDFDKLLQKVTADSSFSIIHDNKLIVGGSELNYVTHSFSEGDYLYRFTGNNSGYSRKRAAYTLIGFLADHRTLIIYRSSS